MLFQLYSYHKDISIKNEFVINNISIFLNDLSFGIRNQMNRIFLWEFLQFCLFLRKNDVNIHKNVGISFDTVGLKHTSEEVPFLSVGNGSSNRNRRLNTAYIERYSNKLY